MEVTESTGCFGRMIGAFFGIGFGLFLLLAGPSLLFWNEGRAVKTSRAIAEGASTALHVDAASPAAANDGKLVHINGEATTDEVLSDKAFGIAEQAIALRRVVEMYQWKQDSDTKKTKKLGGSEKRTTVYTYEKVWSDKLISSKNFKEPGHENPSEMPFEEDKTWAREVSVGGFQLGDTLKTMIGGERDFVVTTSHLGQSQFAAEPTRVKLKGGSYYVGVDPSAPAIGDSRVSFQITSPAPVSVLGKQEGTLLGTYTTSNGYAVHDLTMGTKSMSEMFEQQESTNGIIAWVVRGLGTFMVFLGITFVLGPVRVFADIIPFAGRVAGFMVGVVAALGAGACALPTIGIAWVVYRPLLGIALLLLGALFFAGVVGAIALAFKLSSSKE